MAGSLPDGRTLSQLSPGECYRLLDKARVTFEEVPADAAPGVYAPVYVLSTLGGISIVPRSGMNERALLDCRLAAALLAWSPTLREAGVVGIEHFSGFRPGARVRRSGKTSGHAHALALDAARFRLADGRVLDVERTWEQRERGGPPCPSREDESPDARLLRSVVCDAVDRQLFQVVITPHHDRAHEDHVHVEVVPDVDWNYIR